MSEYLQLLHLGIADRSESMTAKKVSFSIFTQSFFLFSYFPPPLSLLWHLFVVNDAMLRKSSGMKIVICPSLTLPAKDSILLYGLDQGMKFVKAWEN